MKAKIFIILIAILLTCGCSVDYTLSIDSDNNYYEDVVFTSEENEPYSKEYYYNEFRNEYPIYNSEEYMYYAPYDKLKENTYYEKTIKANEYGYVADYKANFNNDSYKDSRMLLTAFSNANIGYNAEGRYYFLYLKDMSIFSQDNNITKINVTIYVPNNYVIINNNADSVYGNKCTWTFTKRDSTLLLYYQKKDNYKKMKNIEYENKEENDDQDEDDVKSKNKKTLWIVGAVVVGIYILLIVILKRFKKM